MGIERNQFNKGKADKDRRTSVLVRQVKLDDGQTMGQRVIRKVASSAYGPHDYRRLCAILGIDPKTGELIEEIEDAELSPTAAIPTQGYGPHLVRRSASGVIRGTRNPHHL